jgi:hypothetical protein
MRDENLRTRCGPTSKNCPTTNDENSPLIDPAHVRERDIDLLLLEELYASNDFQKYFLDLLKRSPNQWSLPENLRFQSARRSIWDEYGQCDLQIGLQDDEENRCWLLIENKIDAELQPNQAARYRKRCEEYKRIEPCSESRTVIAAPQEYLKKGNEGFDYGVSYEAIRDWFSRAAELGQRRAYKIALLDAAISRMAAGIDFRKRYLAVVPSELKASESGRRIKFQPESLSSDVFIIHRLITGWVELRMPPSRMPLPTLDGSMNVKRIKGHITVSAQVPRLKVKDSFESQREKVKQGIAAVRELCDWFKRASMSHTR